MSVARARMLTIRSAEIVELGGAVAGASNARTRWRKRRGLQLTLRDDDGCFGLGEATPLPGYSSDTLAECRSALASVAWSGLQVSTVAEVTALCADVGSPAARFAVETALLALLAERRSCAVAALLAEHMNRPLYRAASLCALVTNPLEREQALAEVAGAWARGVRCIKVKLGRPGRFTDELALLRAIRARYGSELAIRLDANRSWTIAQARACLPELVEIRPEFIEEPCRDLLALGGQPVPLAADESLIGADAKDVNQLLATGTVAALILKPMVLGGLLPALELANMARAHGAAAVPSHLFDGPVAMAAYGHFAALVGGTCGLDRHAGLTAWPKRAIPGLQAARISARVQRERFSFKDAANRYGDAPFVIHASGAVTYRQMAEMVTTQAANLKPGAPISLVAERTPTTIATILAALTVGAPALLLHPRSTTEERERCLALAPGHGSNADLVLFTSGSSGAPKGVLIDVSALRASAEASARHLGWQPNDRWLCCLPLAHIGGLSIVIRCLLAGAGVVLTQERSFDARALATTISEQRVTLLSLVPTMLTRLLDAGWTAPAHLRAVLVGGAASSQELLRRARKREVPALVTYGMTETCSQIATQTLGERLPAVQEVGHIGPLLAGVEVETRAGRLWIRTPSLCRGYLGASEDAEARFDARGFFDTGDRGFVDDAGHLHVRGRADDTIITGGENVDPVEVENVLCRHPDIAAACVFGVPDSTWGHLLAAAVVCVDGASLNLNEVSRFLRANLSVHKRVRLMCQLPELAPDGQLKVRRREVASRVREHLRAVDDARQ